MKRISLVLIISVLLNFNLISKAVEGDFRELQITKKQGLYGVEDKAINETVIPFEYKKIKKLSDNIFKVKNQNNKWEVLNSDNEAFLEGEFDRVTTKIIKEDENPDNIIVSGIHRKPHKLVHIKSPSYSSGDFIEKVFEKNNELSWIKFYDYPKDATIIIKKKDKYGYISSKDGKFIYLAPKYHNIYVPDNNTSVFRALGISYSDIKNIRFYDGYYWFNTDENGKELTKFSYLMRQAHSPYLEEDIKIEDDELIFNYKIKDTTLDNVVLTGHPNKNDEYFGIGQIISYPNDYIEKTKDSINIFEKKKTYSIPLSNYEDVYFQDSNTIIYNIKNISLSNPNRIFVKKQGLWGIIDKSENIIADFQYEDITSLPVKENVELIENDKKYDLKYKNPIFPKESYFLVKKDNKFSVIDINGTPLIPYKETINEKNILEINPLTYKKIQKPFILSPFKLNNPFNNPYVFIGIEFPVIQNILDDLI